MCAAAVGAKNARRTCAVVTGGSRGIGRAIALELAVKGVNVCVCFKSDEAAAGDTVAQAVKTGVDAFYFRADVSKETEVRSLFSAVEDRWGGVEVLVNNAGIYERSSFTQMGFADWKRTIENDLDSIYLCCSAAVPYMKKNGFGRIINISSQLALKGSRHGAHYAAAKAGILGFTRSLAIELGGAGITVNAVLPGSVKTRILGRYSEEQLEEMARSIPVGRIGTAEDVAHTVAFLASSEADYINGASINVSGGLLMY